MSVRETRTSRDSAPANISGFKPTYAIDTPPSPAADSTLGANNSTEKDSILGKGTFSGKYSNYFDGTQDKNTEPTEKKA